MWFHRTMLVCEIANFIKFPYLWKNCQTSTSLTPKRKKYDYHIVGNRSKCCFLTEIVGRFFMDRRYYCQPLRKKNEKYEVLNKIKVRVLWMNEQSSIWKNKLKRKLEKEKITVFIILSFCSAYVVTPIYNQCC